MKKNKKIYNEQGPHGQYSSYIKKERKRKMVAAVQGVNIDNEEE
jgi:hypothetical protein